MPFPTDLGVYVHVPFCRVHCPYCDFYTYPTERGRQQDFVDALLVEVAQVPHRLRPESYALSTVYFGGGTPSTLTPVQIGQILGALRHLFASLPDCEITLEANPRDLHEEYLASLSAMGVTRISLGVQSFFPDALRFLGRDHDPGEVERSLALLAGWSKWSADLIFGWSGQTELQWGEDLDSLLAFEPPHVSLYQLTVEKQTRFGVLASRGRLKQADLDRQAALYAQAQVRLESAGLEQYEISSFARSNCRSRHNGRYWRRRPYLGLGPAAHSHLAERRTENVRSLPRYIERLRRDASPVAQVEVLAPDAIARERVWLGLRTEEGIPVAWLPHVVMPLLEEAERSGLVQRGGDARVALTGKGMAVADEFAARILRVMEA